jgi:mannosyltransferase OCH1-like enzyme
MHWADNINIISDDFDVISNTNVSKIPKILHLIWVGDSPTPDYLDIFLMKWKELMPNWNIRLWTNEDITNQHFPEKILPIIYNCTKGAQKADIMRYFIIEKYGGVYVDTDMIPHRSLDLLLTEFENANVILCHDIPLTWQYIINAFFAALPHHDIFKKACELCYHIKINTEDIHLKSGPRLLGEAVSTTSFEKNEVVLLPIKYFYRNSDYDKRFATHMFVKMW